MQGTVYLSKMKIVPAIKNLICRCLLYDCEMCFNLEFKRFTTGVNSCIN